MGDTMGSPERPIGGKESQIHGATRLKLNRSQIAAETGGDVLHPPTSLPGKRGRRVPAKEHPGTRTEHPLRKRIAPAAIALTLLTGGGAAAYGTLPAFHEGVNNTLNKIGLNLGETPVSPIYDSNVDFQPIQAGINAISISEVGLPPLFENSIKPLEKDKLPDVTILLPVKLSRGQRIDVATNWVDGAWNPIKQKPDRMAYGRKISIGKSGTQIVVPVEKAQVFKIEPRVIEGKTYFAGAILRFYGPDGTKFDLGISSPEDIRQIIPIDILENAPTTDSKGNPIGDGIVISGGTPIIRTDRDNAEVTFTLFAYSSLYPNRRVPTLFNLLQTNNGNSATVIYLSQ